MLKFIKKGMSNLYQPDECLPVYGLQHRGLGPKGVMDQGAYNEACVLLGMKAICLEFSLAPEIEFAEAGSIVLTGAPYQSVLLDGEALSFHKVYHVKNGQVLRFSQRLRGFRTYLTYTNKTTEWCIIGKDFPSWWALCCKFGIYVRCFVDIINID